MTAIHKYIFGVFIGSVILMFAWLRPVNNAAVPFIAGDGLGYYSHLPATFIYHDKEYKYKWFNAVHDSNYIYSAFPDPSQNLLVEYRGRKVNKYYPGLAFAWMPFFFTAHLLAEPLGAKADGYSWPYQYAIGIASIFYILLGLIFLRKLLLLKFGSEAIACWIPVAIFYGTPLFMYTLHGNSLTHAYSFTFIVMFLHAIVKVGHRSDYAFNSLLIAAFWWMLVTAVRPLDGAVALLVPALLNWKDVQHALKKPTIRWSGWLSMLLFCMLLACSIYISVAQTGRMFTYTYTNERFHFEKTRFLDAMFSYYLGQFVYVPLTLLGIIGCRWMGWKQGLLFAGLFLLMLFMYSSWWFWPIVNRAMIDFYGLTAVMLGAMFSGLTRTRATVAAVVTLSVAYFQLKNYQIHAGILSEYNTYSELYWRNFFRLKHADIYPVTPSTIISEVTYDEAFENSSGSSEEHVSSGRKSLCLNKQNFIATVMKKPLPTLFDKPGQHHVRFSFDVYSTGNVKKLHCFITFLDKDGHNVMQAPFYLNEDHVHNEEWDHKEFGIEPSMEDSINTRNVKEVEVTIWNVESKGNIYVDNVRLEFLLTDKSREIVRD